MKKHFLIALFLLLGPLAAALGQSQRPDDRWEDVGGGVEVDKKTFEAFTVDSGENKGMRWISAWLRYKTPEGATVVAKAGILCERRLLQFEEGTVRYLSGKQAKLKWSKLDMTPGSDWEDVFEALCKKGGPWWKVW